MADIEQNLRRLHDARDVLRRHGTPELADWFAVGVHSCLLDGVPLAHALGLIGGRSVNRAFLQLRRNHELRAAWHAITGASASLTPWQCTGRLVERIRDHLAGDVQADAAGQHIAAAYDCGIGLPGSPAQLHAIVATR
jgi:hypothetical protein